MRIRIHGNDSANQKPAKNIRLSIPSVLNRCFDRVVAPGTCWPSRCQGTVLTEPLPRERVHRAISQGTFLPSRCTVNVFTEPLQRESVYWASFFLAVTLMVCFPLGPFWGSIKGDMGQSMRAGVRVRCWPGVFASLPEQRQAFQLVFYKANWYHSMWPVFRES
jgi:hypothetical protein